MKKTLSILLTLLLLVGMIAVSAVSASAEEHTFHTFDKNGKCACGATYSFDDYSEGRYGYDKTLSFSGANSLTVKIIKLNAWTGSIDFRDGQGNVIEKYSGLYGAVDYTITIPGDTLRVTYMGGNGDPNFNKVNGGFELASITPNYDDNIGSVLSEGNLWIIIAVAVLAIGGVATLLIVKKKKKPIAANGASTDDE